jgi:phosphate uptake regulator
MDMKRKIVKLGPSTMVISLPKKWTEKYGINIGDEINLVEVTGGLLVEIEKKREGKTEKIALNSKHPLIRRIIAAKYMKGCKELEIECQGEDLSRVIHKNVERLIGFEIVEQNRKRILIKTIGTGTDESFDAIFKRLVYITQTMSDEAVYLFKEQEKDMGYFFDMELNLNKLTEFCVRLLSTKGHTKMQATASYYTMVLHLEEIGDSYKEIVELISEHEGKINPKLIKIMKEINDFHRQLTKVLNSYSLENAIALADKRDEIHNKIIKELRKVTAPKDAQILIEQKYLVRNIIRVMNEQMNLH